MKRRWIAALLAGVLLLVLIASGAAAPDPGSKPNGMPETAAAAVYSRVEPVSDSSNAGKDVPDGDVPDAPGSDTDDPPAAGDPADQEPAAEYEFSPQKTAYSFLAVSPQGTVSPFTKPVFQSGTVKVKGGSEVPPRDLRYEWYAADRNGTVESGAQVLGTEASFSTADDPTYDLNRVATHYYLERIYVGSQVVGEQLFYAAVMSTGMDLTVGAEQNGVPVADNLNVKNGPITLTVNYDNEYFGAIRSYIRQNTSGTAVALNTSPTIPTNDIKAFWHPQDVANAGISFSGGSGIVVTPGLTPVVPKLTISSFTSPAGYTDFYFSMNFPFTATGNLLSGGQGSIAGELRTLTRLVRVYSGEQVTTPTPTPGDDPGTVPMPSDWTTNLFAEPPLTQAQSEALYKELITPYSDPKNWRTPFALAPAEMTPEGYLSENSQRSVLNLINFIRRSAGVRTIDTIDPQYTVYCQAGTDYMSAHDQFGHNVADNSGNQNAIRGLQDSNLSWVQYTPVRAASLEVLQLGQFYDDDYNNLPNVGHRRWLLDCRQTRTGFGYTGPTQSNTKSYEATYVLDRVAGTSVPDSLEAFPGIGAFPIELMNFRAWSIGLGMLGGRTSNWTVDENDINMSITRLSDGKSWTFEPFGSGSYLNKNSNWFEVINPGRGSGAMILFRPASIFSSGNFQETEELIGETYTIKIEGIKDENGVARTVIYGTSFYSLANSSVLQPPPTQTAEPTATTEPTQTAEPTTAPEPTPTPEQSLTPSPSIVPTAAPSATRTASPSTTVAPSRTASPTKTASPSRTASPTRPASPSPTPTPTPSPTPLPGPSATAAETVQWWNLTGGKRPVMSVNTASQSACTFKWYALSSAEQSPSSGTLLPDTGSSCVPSTIGWKGGQVYHFACVIQFADQQANGAGETVVPFTIHVEALPDEVAGGTGIEDVKDLPNKPAGVSTGYELVLAPDAFDDPLQPPEITVAGGDAQWSITVIGVNGEEVSVGTAQGATARIPDRAGMYAMTASVGNDTMLFVVPVKGTVEAAPTGASLDEAGDKYTLPYGREETTIQASWEKGVVKSPLAACVEYVWKLASGSYSRAGGPTLTPNGSVVRKLEGENTWIASGEGADTAVLSGLEAGMTVDVSVAPYAPETYESQNPIELGNVSEATVEAARLPVITYPDMTAVVDQAEDACAVPEIEAEPDVAIIYSISSSLPVGGPVAEVNVETGTVTIPATELKEVGRWTYTVRAEAVSGTVTVPVRLTVSEPPEPSQEPTSSPSAAASPTVRPSESPSTAPSASPTVRPSTRPSQAPSTVPTASASWIPPVTRPSAGPTYLPTYNPNPSWTSFPTVPPTASASASESAVVPAITAKPDAAFTVAVVPNPTGSGELLTGVPISTIRTTYTAADVVAAVEVPAGFTLAITTADDKPLAENAPVGTGCIAVVSDGATENRYTIIVKGDVLGTGQLDLSQVVRMAADLTDTRPLVGIYRLAGKLTSGNGPVNIADLVSLARMLIDSENHPSQL